MEHPFRMGSNPILGAHFSATIYRFFILFFKSNFLRLPINSLTSKNQSSFSNIEVFVCADCVFWCGRCSESSLTGKKSINQLASSYGCSKGQPRGGSHK